jgi:hypothetical protein
MGVSGGEGLGERIGRDTDCCRCSGRDELRGCHANARKGHGQQREQGPCWLHLSVGLTVCPCVELGWCCSA